MQDQVLQSDQVYRRLAEIFIPSEEGKERKRIFIFLIFILFWIGFVIFSSQVKVSPEEEVEVEQLPERFAQVVVPQLIEEKKAEATAKIEEKKVEKKVERAQGEGGAPPAGSQQKREIIREKVRSVGVLALLTAKGESGSPIAEILGGSVAQSLDEILGSIGGVRVGSGGEELKPLELAGGVGGGIGRRGADVGDLAAKGGKEVGLGEKKVAQVRSQITAEAPNIEGNLDEETVRKIALKNQVSLKYCFQKAQMRNPNLQGKIVVKLTIDGEGNVSDISLEQSTIDDQEMVSCVLRMVKRWKFPATGSEITITFPLVFVSIT